MTGRQPAVLRTKAQLRGRLAAAPRPVGVVMTMGALHDGHRALLRAARQRCATVVATVFVNPLQFASGEDLERYPRPFERDVQVCVDERVDLVFAPAVEEMYGDGPAADRVTVSAGRLGTVLEGAVRPGHFDGVLTVVCKLLRLTSADVAYFGRKDAQQLVLVRRLVDDLDLDVDVVAVPTVRTAEGLALSSRNAYLDDAGRATALALPRALAAARAAAPDGPVAVRAAAGDVLAATRALAVDYVALVDPRTLRDVADATTGDALLLVAARVGGTRLLDNTALVLGADRQEQPV